MHADKINTKRGSMNRVLPGICRSALSFFATHSALSLVTRDLTQPKFPPAIANTGSALSAAGDGVSFRVLRRPQIAK
eukprot:2640634-Rhodomonas_salina.1